MRSRHCLAWPRAAIAPAVKALFDTWKCVPMLNGVHILVTGWWVRAIPGEWPSTSVSPALISLWLHCNYPRHASHCTPTKVTKPTPPTMLSLSSSWLRSVGSFRGHFHHSCPVRQGIKDITPHLMTTRNIRQRHGSVFQYLLGSVFQYLLAPSSPILLLSQVLSSSKIHWRRCSQLKLLRRREAATASADHWAICRLLGLSHRPRITSTRYLVTIGDIDQDHKKFKFAILGYRYYYSCQSFASQPVCKILWLIELVFLGLTSAAFSESVLTCLDVVVGWKKLVWGNPSHLCENAPNLT